MNLVAIGAVRKIAEDETAIEILAPYRRGLFGVAPDDRLDILYWMSNLDPDQRLILRAHPRGDQSRPLKGVFGLRSPMRPNPIGVSTVRVIRVEQGRLIVTPFDAMDNSPVIDIKASAKNQPPSA